MQHVSIQYGNPSLAACLAQNLGFQQPSSVSS
jgi:hypothetical protein